MRFEGRLSTILSSSVYEIIFRLKHNNGFRGALLFKRGEYRVEGKLHIRTSGVVLRGEGDDENGTVIIGTGTAKRTLIEFQGSGNHVKVAGTRQAIVFDEEVDYLSGRDAQV